MNNPFNRVTWTKPKMLLLGLGCLAYVSCAIRFNLLVLDLGIYFIPVGMLATLFLRGFPRVLVITAWLLMTVFMGHFYIA